METPHSMLAGQTNLSQYLSILCLSIYSFNLTHGNIEVIEHEILAFFWLRKFSTKNKQANKKTKKLFPEV